MAVSQLDDQPLAVLCYYWWELPQVSFLSRQTRVTTNIFRDTHMFVMTSRLLS